MLITINNIDKDKYKLLIEYAYIRCDMFTLRVPTDILEEDNEFQEGIKLKLKKIEPYIIKKYIDDVYFYNIGGDCYIYVVSLDKELLSFFIDAEGLYNWEYPKNMPEDLCFISKGKCWLESVAHEEICRIYTESPVEKDILKRIIGLKFVERDDFETPTLEL